MSRMHDRIVQLCICSQCFQSKPTAAALSHKGYLSGILLSSLGICTMVPLNDFICIFIWKANRYYLLASQFGNHAEEAFRLQTCLVLVHLSTYDSSRSLPFLAGLPLQFHLTSSSTIQKLVKLFISVPAELSFAGGLKRLQLDMKS
jgi:hypothetical protein